MTQSNPLLSKIFFLQADGPYPKWPSEPAIAEYVQTFGNFTNIQPLLPGSRHRVYKIETEKEKFIFRIGLGKGAEYEFSLDQYIPTIIGAEIPTPQLITSGRFPRRKSWHYQLFKFVEGELLFKITDTSIVIPAIEELGCLVRKLHQYSAEHAGPLTVSLLQKQQVVGIHTSWNTFLHLCITSECHFLLNQKIITDKESTLIQTALKKNVPLISPVLLHGDISHHNTLVKGSRIVGMLDWENSLAGDPLYDIAYYATGCFNHPDWLEAFFQGYFAKTYFPHEYIDRFNYYFLRISLAKSVSRIRQQKQGIKLPDLRARILLALSKMR